MSQKSGHPAQALQFLHVDQDETKRLLFTGKGNLFSVIGINEDENDDAYLQLFDAAATSDVTLGSTTPVWQIKLHNNTTIQHAFEFPLFWFSKGCVLAVTKTKSGSDAPTTDCTTTFHYQVNR